MDDNKLIPTGWKKVKMGEVFTIERGGSPRPIEDYITNDPNGINWIKIGDTKGVSKYITRTNEKIKPEGLKKTRMVYEDDFVLSNSMSFGRPYIMKTSGAIHDGWLVIRKNEDVDKDFLYYCLSSNNVYAQFTKLAKGSTVKNLNIDAVKQVDIPLPPKPTQLAIVSKIEELFSELDKGIEQLKTAQQQLKTYRQAVLKWAFEGKLTEEWRTAVRDRSAPQELSLAAEAETNYGTKSELPEGWKWVKIDYLLSDAKKGMSTGPFGTMLKKSEHQPNGVPVLGIENIGEGMFKMPNKIFITEEKANELKNFKVNENDIIISRSGTVGEICMLPKLMANSVISTNLIRLTLNSNIIVPKYFVFMFQGGKVRQDVFDLCKGSSRAFLNQTILKALDFPYCTIDEQNAIVEEIESRFSIADKIEESINQSLQQAEALRQSILKKAFEGRLIN